MTVHLLIDVLQVVVLIAIVALMRNAYQLPWPAVLLLTALLSVVWVCVAALVQRWWRHTRTRQR
jgi:hypothetical protein